MQLMDDNEGEGARMPCLTKPNKTLSQGKHQG